MTLSSRLRRWTRKKGARTVESANAEEIAVPEFPTETLWHYTNTAGLLGILNNVDKKAEDDKPRSGTYKPILHASAAQFLNDRRELTLGLELIKDGLVELGVRGSFDHTPEAKAFLSKRLPVPFSKSSTRHTRTSFIARQSRSRPNATR